MKHLYAYDLKTGERLPGSDIVINPDENGKYTIPKGFTDKEVPIPNWKISFKNGEWVETDAESYNNWLANKDKPVELPKSEVEILKEELTAARRETAEMNVSLIGLWEILLG